MDNILLVLSNSKILNGVVMLMTNIGGKYLIMELPANIDNMFTKYSFLRYCVLFSILFMATRDIKISILLLLLVILLLKFFTNEKSNYCLIESSIPVKQSISKDEYEKAKKTILNYEIIDKK